MATKRDRDSEEASPAPSVKRTRNSDRHRSSGNYSSKKQQHQQQQQTQEPATDITYGQRCCFPGLNEAVIHSDEDIDFEDETDALAYLQTVRQQASGIPHLLVAPKSGPQLPPGADESSVDRSIYTNGHGDTRGYYQDGAYTAAPHPRFRANQRRPPSRIKGQELDYDDYYDDEDEEGEYDIHDTPNDDSDATSSEIATAYFDALAAQFSLLRARLHQTPPPAALAALPNDRSPTVGRFGRDSHTFAVWSNRLRLADPHPAQVAAMDKSAVLRVLRVLLSGKFLRSGAELRERTSRWLWALLARLPDRGEMDHTEVGHVRELGKRAALLMHTLREMALLREEVELGAHDEDAAAAEWLGSDDDGEGESGGDNSGRVDVKAELQNEEKSTDKDGQAAVAARRAAAAEEETEPPSTTLSNIQKDNQPDEDMEDGEITDEGIRAGNAVETAKARLLASLDDAASHVSEEAGSGQIDQNQRSSGIKDAPDAVAAGGASLCSSDPVRARMNMRATLNMILTVAGEFYGQRDLLEFRDPFHGV